MSVNTSPSRLGLALGSGSARGLAHIGVIRALAEFKLEPHIICGTSIGALIGAVYAAGKLDRFEAWARDLKSRDILRYMDITFVTGGGFADGSNLIQFFREEIGDINIEELDKPFAAVATHFHSGREIWLREGNLWDAVRASIALPGILTPATIGGRLLVDGGLVNPVPVSLCRAMDADAVIAVNLNGDVMRRHTQARPSPKPLEAIDAEADLLEQLSRQIKARATNLLGVCMDRDSGMPGVLEVISASLNIMQDRITRSRLAGDPADVILEPRLAHIGLLEFDRADEAIEEGQRSVRRSQSVLEDKILNTLS